MRNLLNFLARYTNLLLFIALEVISVYILVNGENYYNTRMVMAMKGVTRGVDAKISNSRNYFSLRESNRALSAENVELRNRIVQLTEIEDSASFREITDSLYRQQFFFTSAEVINNSINRQKNFFTINKGTDQGVNVDMAVTSGNSVAGIIVGCSRNYSVAMSLLNIDFKISARIRSNGYFGSLNWNGRNYRKAVLSEIPQHVNINVGDTIETTGYSAIVPEGMIVGTVADFNKPGGDFYNITVLLSTDFKKLQYVEVIGNLRKTEQIELEKMMQ